MRNVSCYCATSSLGSNIPISERSISRIFNSSISGRPSAAERILSPNRAAPVLLIVYNRERDSAESAARLPVRPR